MSFGKQIRSAYLGVIEEAGQPIVVHNQWNTEQATSFETRGLFGKGFDFPELVDVQKGSVLQVKGSRDLWRVVDTEEDFQGGEFIYLSAKVEKIDMQGHPTRPPSASNAIFNGPITGGVQVGGHQNVQHISIVKNQEVEELVSQLIGILRASELSELDKDDAIEAAQRLPQLAQNEKTPDVIQRAKDRLELIKSAVEVSSIVAGQVAPIYEALCSYFGL